MLFAKPSHRLEFDCALVVLYVMLQQEQRDGLFI